MEIIQKYFTELSPLQVDQFDQLKGLYEYWNDQINVISRKDMESFYTHHVLHGLSIAKFIHFSMGTKILDLGTGGGFPGIPLAIMFPESHFFLVDGKAKKIKVVQEVTKALKLENVISRAVRAEELKKMKFDFVTARAVTKLDRLVEWTQKLISDKHKNALPNGLIALKGGDLKEEMKSIKRPIEVQEISKYFPIPYFDQKRILYIQM